MGVFQSYKNLTKGKTLEEKELEVAKRTVDLLKQRSEKQEEEICNRLPYAIMPIDFNDSVWSTIHEYHDIHWRYWLLHKNERMFVYHLGLANLAKHLPEVRDEYIIPFKQRLVYLQFGKDYPMLCCGLNFMLSYNQHRYIKPEKNVITEIKDAISNGFAQERIVGIEISDRDWESLTSQYIDGCIGLLAEMTIPWRYKDGTVFDNIPNDNRNKTLGDFFDDYFTNNVNKKS